MTFPACHAADEVACGRTLSIHVHHEAVCRYMLRKPSLAARKALGVAQCPNAHMSLVFGGHGAIAATVVVRCAEVVAVVLTAAAATTATAAVTPAAAPAAAASEAPAPVTCHAWWTG